MLVEEQWGFPFCHPYAIKEELCTFLSLCLLQIEQGLFNEGFTDIKYSYNCRQGMVTWTMLTLHAFSKSNHEVSSKHIGSQMVHAYKCHIDCSNFPR